MNDLTDPGAALGRYRIERRLGRGGMGVVFLAYDATLQRNLAIKVLESATHEQVARTRVLQEARHASALNHPNICTVYEVGEESGRAFIAMEYVDGRTLCDLVDRGALAIEDAVQYGIEAADALAHAHERGVVHRDFKAANAIVSSTGHLKIVDFGLARRLDSSVPEDSTVAATSTDRLVAGTPYTMAPEQIRGFVADARTDIWALGVLLYQMLAGSQPFHGATTAELLSSILRDPPPPLPAHIPVPLHQLVRKCLAKDPVKRYQRAADVHLVLEAYASELPGHRRPPSAQIVGDGMPIPPPPMLDIWTGAIGFVGRESELAQLDHAWTRAIGGRRQLVFLAGEPGIGKTRLAAEFARGRAAGGATVLVGRCEEEALIPYQPFVEALNWYVRVCPEAELRDQLAVVGGGSELGPFLPELPRRVPDLPLSPAMNAGGERYRLFETVAGFLTVSSAMRPTLLILDDLHWADKPTLLMLRHIVRSPDTASLCLVGTYRESELGRAHPLAEMLADLRREEPVTRLSLRGLAAGEVRGLVDTFAGRDAPPELARVVSDGTDGNPFFVSEMMRHLIETGALAELQRTADGSRRFTDLGLPEGIKEVIGRRLSRLSEDCNRALSLASVVGREFDLAVLEALVGMPGDQLLDVIDEARRAQLIGEAPGGRERFSFMHALIRETLYGELTSSRRVRLHRRVGETIERLAEGQPTPVADLAYHFVQAASTETTDKAIDYAVRAGERAAEALAHEDAARFYEMALQSLELKAAGPDTEARRSELHAGRARAFGALALWGLERVELERALQHSDPEHVERRSELALKLAAASFWLLDIPGVKRLATEALRLADQAHRSDVAADAMAWLARCHQSNGHLGAAIEMDRMALSRAGGVQTAAFAMGPMALYLAGRHSEAVSFASESAAIARTSRDTGFMMYALSHLGVSLGGAGRYDEAAKVFDEVRQFGRKYGVLPLLARATAMSAGFHLSVFDFEGAEAIQSEARELAQSVGFVLPLVSAGIDLLLTFARRHEPGRAETLLPEMAAVAATTSGQHGWLWQLRLSQARAELALARGALDEAVVAASEGIDQSRARGRRKYEALGLITRAQALHRLGRTHQAIADGRGAVDVARPTADPALLLQALDAVLALDGSEDVAAEARALCGRIMQALPDQTIRARFADSEVVQRIQHY